MNPYVILAFVASLLLTFVGGFERGAHIQKSADQVVALTKAKGDLQAQVAASMKAFDTQKMFADNALRVSSLAAAQSGRTDTVISTLTQERDNYVHTLKSGKCVLSLSDVRSLRAIGGTPAKPVRRLPAAP